MTGLFFQSHPFSELIFFAKNLAKTFCTYNCGQDAILNMKLVIYVTVSLHHRRNSALVKSVYKTAPKSLFWAPTVYQDLNTRHDWPVKKDVVNLPISNKGNSKRTSSNSLSPLGTYNENSLGDASQTSLSDVKVRLRRRLLTGLIQTFSEHE